MSADIDALIARLSPPGSELARDVIAALAAQQARILDLEKERADFKLAFDQHYDRAERAEAALAEAQKRIFHLEADVYS